MSRLSHLAVLLLTLTTAVVAANSRAETSTYIEGSVVGFTPHTGGTLVLGDTLEFRSGLGNIIVPYETIHRAALGVVRTHGEAAPYYKVWSLHKRWMSRTKRRLLTIAFRDADGTDKNMTLELAEDSAGDTLAKIEERTGSRPAPAANADSCWWGDRYWKTRRNAESWNKP